MKPFGFRRISDRILQSERSVLSVDFAGPDRLLISFASRDLIRRDPEATEEDRDRQVEVVLLEISSGKAIARSRWRLHDDQQYLWPLGDGRFLVRERSRLRMFDARLAGDQALVSHPVFEAGNGRVLAGISVTADGSMVEVQTQRGKLIGDDLDLEGDPDKSRSNGFDIRFYRVRPDANALELRAHAQTEQAFRAPFSYDGFLGAQQEDPTHFGFDLHMFVGGATKELAGVETSCVPDASFLSASQFIISGCRGGEARTMTGVLDTSGHVLWLGPEEVSPWTNLYSAPAAGRFAIRKTASNTVASSPLVPDGIVRPTAQRVTVRRIANGDELMQVSGIPVVRASQNFALSHDGLKLAVWEGDAVAIYQLPSLTEKDTAAAKP